jgi:RNA polymerase sigma-70 factor (ECF subfamily)
LAYPTDNPNPSHDLADLHALQAGSEAALNRLVERWQKPLFGFAWRYVHNTEDARDLAAETMVRLYQHRARLAADSNVSAWLFTTLANLCRNHHRWRERHPSASLEQSVASGEQSSETPNPAATLEQKETLDALAAAIDRLPHDLKVTLLLHHYERLSYQDIGEVTGCSERGVETRLYRARQRLRGDLMEKSPEGKSRGFGS